MASNSGRGNDSSNNQTPNDTTNPFTKFSQFVDSQISAFLHDVIGLPSGVARQAANNAWIDGPSANPSMRRAEGEGAQSGSTDDKKGNTESNDNALRRWEAWTSGNHDSVSSTLDLLNIDHERLFDDLNKIQNELFGNFGWSVPQNFFSPDRSILSYILLSSYSPLTLHAYYPELLSMTVQRGDEKMPFPFTEAFEDLLLASQGKPIQPLSSPQTFSYHPQSHAWIHSWEQTANDGMSWIQKLYDNGLLSSNGEKNKAVEWHRKWQYPEETRTAQKEIEQNKELKRAEPETEQDTYDWLAGNTSPKSDGQPPSILDHMMHRHQQLHDHFFKKGDGFLDGKSGGNFNGSFGFESSSSTTSSSRDENGNFISTTTTTERHMLEDGSIQTKTVTRKRFADGRESSTETTHLERPQQQRLETPAAVVEDNQDTKIVQQLENKKSKDKGWFWN